MSKAQTDIRSTSYDALAARPFGYTGTIDEVIAQIRSEPDTAPKPFGTERAELLMFLGVNKVTNTGPSVELDENPRYGVPENNEPGFYTLAYAQKHFPDSFRYIPSLGERLLALDAAQLRLYQNLREKMGVREALARAEAYPYPAPQS